MTIIHDTRDKAGKHENVDNYLMANGHMIIRSKLFVGDVARLDNQTTVIDLKRNLTECCLNLAQQHKRFTAECIRAQENGIKLVVLVEHGGQIKSLESIKNWVNPRLKVSPYAISGERLYRLMLTYSDKYGVEWRFCDKRSTGRIIVEILGGERNEAD